MFKDIKDDDIDGIQVYGQTQLIHLLTKKAEECGQQMENDLLTAFYGIYCVCPEKFQFVTGDRKLISKLAVRVSEKLAENEGCKFFEQKSLPRKRKCILNNTTDSAFGLIYGNLSRRPIPTATADFHRDDLQKKLFEQSKKIFDTYKDEMTARNCPQFSIDLVDIDINDNGIKGNVVCGICRKQRTKVFFKHTGSTTYSWVMSNVKSHVINCLKSHESNKENNNGMEQSNCNSNGNSPRVTTSLNITPVDDFEEMQSHLEGIISGQIAIQVVHMTNTAFQCEDRQVTVKCNFGPKLSNSLIKACDVSSNGDCFFAAASHQIKYVKINSAEHQMDTENLRKVTAKYIEENLQTFKHDLKNRLLELGQMIDEENLDDQCLDFVRNQLVKSGTFAGRECFEAVSAINEVNIVVFNERGTCYFGSKFNPSYDKSILITFRGSNNGQKNEDRNHFGSVTEIKSKLVTNVSKLLIENHMQYIRNKNRNSVINID